jgi:hypothetical protein
MGVHVRVVQHGPFSRVRAPVPLAALPSGSHGCTLTQRSPLFDQCGLFTTGQEFLRAKVENAAAGNGDNDTQPESF